MAQHRLPGSRAPRACLVQLKAGASRNRKRLWDPIAISQHPQSRPNFGPRITAPRLGFGQRRRASAAGPSPPPPADLRPLLRIPSHIPCFLGSIDACCSTVSFECAYWYPRASLCTFQSAQDVRLRSAMPGSAPCPPAPTHGGDLCHQPLAVRMDARLTRGWITGSTAGSERTT